MQPYRKARIIKAPTGVGGTPIIGTPYSTQNAWASATVMRSDTAVFTCSKSSDNPNVIASRIQTTRGLGKKMVPMMTSGSHSRYRAPGLGNFGPNNEGFSLDFWKHGNPAFPGSGMDPHATVAIRAAVAAGVADGTIPGCDMIDEPQNGDWGGNITKAMIDEMARYIKNTIFPGVPIRCGLSVRSDYRANEGPYVDVDWILVQWIDGAFTLTVQQWRDLRLQQAFDNNVRCVMAFNVLNGGTPNFNETPASCASKPQTGGISPVSNERCSMGTLSTATYPGGQIVYFGQELMKPCSTGTAIGTQAVCLNQWDWNADFYARSQNKAAFATLAGVMVERPTIADWARF